MQGSTLGPALVAAALLIGCGNHGNPEPASLELVEAGGSKKSDDELPRRIYYDLTKYPWYQRAEPLVHEQVSFAPRGAPIVIPLAKLHLEGNYQGVDFYTLRDDEARPDALYVPVYEGYWLPFVATTPDKAD